jgi:lysophospholipase L1-like esterase
MADSYSATPYNRNASASQRIQPVKDNTETALPVYVIGDSHALPYRNLMFRERWAERWIAVHARYVSGLTAHDLIEIETSDFHPGIIQFLEYEGLVRNGNATHLSAEEIDFSIAKATGQSVKPPLILFTVGDIDIRAAILPCLRDAYDFIPPFETGLPELNLPLVPWDVIGDMIRRRIAPMVVALEQLLRAGFNRLYVQAVVPPTRDEARVKQLQGYACPVSVRTKLVMAFNQHLAAECGRIGVKFLDLWAKLTEAGYLRADLEVDGVHMPPCVARWFVDAMLEDAINCQWFAVNHARYELYYREACGLSHFQPAAGI